VIARGWKIVVALALLGLVGGALMWAVVPPAYLSTTRFFVASDVTSEDPEELFNRNEIAAQRINSYLPLILSDKMTDAVIKWLGDNGPEGDFADKVTATTIPETVIIDVQVEASSPEESQRLAEAYGAVAPGVISAVEAVGSDQAAQVALTEIEAPDLGRRETPGLGRSLLFGALLGLVLGVGGLVLWGAVRRETAVPGSAM
jgi:receptor protein-tyrosine kinase